MKNFNILDYINEAEELEKLFSKFINLCEEYQVEEPVSYEGLYGRVSRRKIKVTDRAKPLQRELLRKYETWFAVTNIIVKQYSDRHSEF